MSPRSLQKGVERMANGDTSDDARPYEREEKRRWDVIWRQTFAARVGVEEVEVTPKGHSLLVRMKEGRNLRRGRMVGAQKLLFLVFSGKTKNQLGDLCRSAARQSTHESIDAHSGHRPNATRERFLCTPFRHSAEFLSPISRLRREASLARLLCLLARCAERQKSSKGTTSPSRSSNRSVSGKFAGCKLLCRN